LMAAKRADLGFHHWADSFEETETRRQKKNKKTHYFAGVSGDGRGLSPHA